METEPFFRKMQALLSLADVTINGDRPWDIQIHNREFFPRVLSKGSLGLGEAYMDGWWDCESIDGFICRVLEAGLDSKINPWRECLPYLKACVLNLQKPASCFSTCRHHYDIGNDLYLCMLDRRQIYSCGYWKSASCLDEAQEEKLDLVCRKLCLEPGMRVLDIGCGWGGTAKYMAEKYQVEVVGITVSSNQAAYAREVCAGLPVEIRLEDYRRISDVFDRIVSIGMIEHVGCKNYRTYMKTVSRCLRENGLFLLQTIAGNTSVRKTDPWISKYIFPNSMLPSARQLTRAMESLFVIEDWHSFGPDYDRTLMHWYENFEAGWNTIGERYGERFYRMWKFYLLSCAGSFRARVNQLWQIVLSPKGAAPTHYLAPR